MEEGTKRKKTEEKTATENAAAYAQGVPKDLPRAALPDPILTIDVDAHVESFQEKEDARWHSILNAHRTRKILSGTLSGIETLESGWVVAVTYYNGFRVIIPMEEMMINLSGDGRENANTLNRQTRIANNMLGCQIDFMVKDLDAESKSVVASRKDAMMKKRQMFYESENPEEKPMLYPGRIVEARVIAVAARAVRLEVFGVEVSVRARDMAWEWMVDAGEKYSVGDLVLVAVEKVQMKSVDDISITVNAKTGADTNKDNLKKCHKNGKYAGIVTDVYKGTYFIRLSIGVNAVAHFCSTASLPAKRDQVGFVATRINDSFEVAEGIITRIIRRYA
ncbi:MAG: S1 RNA-binding domain-containing protein [Lachnospiraceae bacterium]|nr:S1 RNA-binding domain-containing protein [Lachnospiraceae bacterium]